jgi:hypothetical protein
MANKYKTTDGNFLSDFLEEILDEAGGIPEEYKERVTIPYTNEKDLSNPGLILSLDGKAIGGVWLFGLWSSPITAKLHPSTLLAINPDWNIIKRDKKGNEKIWGKEIDGYGDSIYFKNVKELIKFYDKHKAEIEKLTEAFGPAYETV